LPPTKDSTVPPSRRSNRGGAFGGSLLAVPNPLPDDDLILPAEDSPTEREFDTDTKVPASLAAAHSPSPALEPKAQEEDDAHPVSALRGSAVGRRPPSTIRIDDKAGHQLFEAFVEAKRQDPFLSYRQFASSIVLDGLNVHHRRQKRA
jgi:hypothetical protein